METHPGNDVCGNAEFRYTSVSALRLSDPPPTFPPSKLLKEAIQRTPHTGVKGFGAEPHWNLAHLGAAPTQNVI